MSKFKEYDKKTLKKLHDIEIEMLKDINRICEKYDIKYFALDGTGIGAMRHKGFIPWDDDIDLRFIEEDAIKFRKCVEKDLSDKYYFIDIHNSGYPINFFKMCKKNTLFIDTVCKNSKIDMGIFIDIFPMVYVSDNEEERNKKVSKSWYLYKLATIIAIKNPEVQVHGIKGKLIVFGCNIIHYLFKLFKVSYVKMFDKAKKIAQSPVKTNTIASLNTVRKNTSIYELKDIFPVKKVEFEDTYVYVPKEIDKLLRMYFGDYMKLPPLKYRHNHLPEKLIFDIECESDKYERND